MLQPVRLAVSIEKGMIIAAGFASEVEYQLLFACNLNDIQDETYRELNQQVNEVKQQSLRG
jgi:hypothetical protein